MRSPKIFILLLILFPNLIYSQPIPGKFLLKGNSAITGQFFSNQYSDENGNKTPEHKTTQFNFQPSIGIFLSHAVILGINTGYSYHNDKVNDAYDKSSSFIVGPFIRCYLSDTPLEPFVHFNIGYASNHVSQKAANSRISDNLDLNGFNFSLGSGLEYFIGSKYSFEFLIDYNHSSLSKGEINNNLILRESGLEFRIGVSVFLN